MAPVHPRQTPQRTNQAGRSLPPDSKHRSGLWLRFVLAQLSSKRERAGHRCRPARAPRSG